MTVYELTIDYQHNVTDDHDHEIYKQHVLHLDPHRNEDVQKSADGDSNRQQSLAVGCGFLGQVLRVLQVSRDVVVVVLLVAPIYAHDQADECGEQEVVLSG